MFILGILLLGILIYLIFKVKKRIFKILLLIPILALVPCIIIYGGIILLIFLEAGGM